MSASLSLVAVQAAEAAIDSVTTCANSGPGSLPVVVGAAAPGDTIEFSVSCPPGSPITLASTITLTQDLTVSGPGTSTLAVSGGGAAGVFAVNSGVTATISGITIESGSAYVGAGISNDGALSVTDAVLSGDSANSGGGGIYNGSGATLDVTDSLFPGDDNYWVGGGGIQNNGSMDVVDSTFSGDSDYYGGAAIQNNATGTVTGSTFTGSSAYASGGAFYNDGALTIADSTIAGNSAYYGGGGIYNVNVLHIVNSTVTGNGSAYGGGDIANGGPMTIAATIVGGSTPECSGVGGATLGYNLDEDGSCGFTGPGDLSDTPAGLDPGGLQDNGGPTQTIALEPGSVAIDGVTGPSLCPATDQRGDPRHMPCDIGAYDTDTHPATPTTPTIANLPASGTYGGSFAATVSTTGDGVTSVTSSTTGVCTAFGLVVSYVGVGTCTLTPQVATGTDYFAASGSPVSFAIGPPAPTTPTIAVTGSALPSSPGPVTYTVTVTGSGATPTGSVAVSDDQGGSCSISILSAGSGSCAIDESTSPSPYTVSASYSGDGNYNAGITTLTVIANTCQADATCTSTANSASQVVEVTATAGATTASVAITVAPQALNCGPHFNSVAPVTTLTDGNIKTGSDLTVIDKVADLPSAKGVAICYQPVTVPPTPPAFLAKCHGKHFVAPCYKSLTEMGGSVVATLEVPAGDPRYHIGGETPSVSSYSPASAKPGHKLTIKGENLSEVTGVTIGGAPAHITATAPTKVTVTVPAGSKGGVVVVSSSAGVAVGSSVTVSGVRVQLPSAKLRRHEHRRR